MSGGIVPLDPANREHVAAAARLHTTLLGHSPIPRLGNVFMTRFFYTSLVDDGLIRCYLYRLDGEYVGFLSFTERPFSFMRDGQRSHLLRLAAVLTAAIVERPSRLQLLLDARKAGRRDVPPDADGVGEFLSFGVLEQHAADRDAASGLRIPNLLFDAGIRHFRERGFRRIEWNVDSDNLKAILLYRSYGATLEKSPLAWPSDYRVRLDLQAQTETSR